LTCAIPFWSQLWISAAGRITIKNLFIKGLETAIGEDAPVPPNSDSLARCAMAIIPGVAPATAEAHGFQTLPEYQHPSLRKLFRHHYFNGL
jgi:hypothetical protein